jgi:5-formyltetrahydrofolate cyclo-ligase
LHLPLKMNPKNELRLLWKKKLLQIPPERRTKAAIAITNHLFPAGVIASFSSFREEINTQPLNLLLAQKGRLVLPRVEKEHLVFYHVNHPDKELAPSQLGILEPIPSLCKAAEKIDVILVPALAFDKELHRLGYGKGYYDRILTRTSAFSIGIGFTEQLTELLPHDSHDRELKELCLF